jgi:hypothetical protein
VVLLLVQMSYPLCCNVPYKRVLDCCCHAAQNTFLDSANREILIITWSVLRQVRSLFQSEISGCDLVLALPIYSIFSFPEGHSVAAYVFSHVFPSLLSSISSSATCFRRQFLHKMRPVHLAFGSFMSCSYYGNKIIRGGKVRVGTGRKKESK